MRATAALLVITLLPGLADDLRRELAGADRVARVAILEALPARIGKAKAGERPAVARHLLRILDDPEQGPLHAACYAPLVATESAAGVSAAIRQAYDRDATPRRAAARRALATEGGASVTAELLRQLRVDASARARAHLALLIGRRGDPAAGPGLLAALSDPEAMVRGAAAEALTRIWRRAHGYDAEAWEKAVRVPPPAPAPEAEPETAEPGEIVTKPAPPRDPEAEVAKLAPEFYGLALDRALVVVVLDFSGSIRGEAARVVRARLRGCLDLLPSTRRVMVFAFDERLFAFGSAPVAMDPDAKLELADFLSGLPPGRRTELLVPIRTGLAAAERHGGTGAQVLIVSDGQPTAAGPSLDAIIEQAKALKGRDVRVDAAIYGGRKVGLFSWLAKETGGTVTALPALK